MPNLLSTGLSSHVDFDSSQNQKPERCNWMKCACKYHVLNHWEVVPVVFYCSRLEEMVNSCKENLLEHASNFWDKARDLVLGITLPTLKMPCGLEIPLRFTLEMNNSGNFFKSNSTTCVCFPILHGHLFHDLGVSQLCRITMQIRKSLEFSQILGYLSADHKFFLPTQQKFLKRYKPRFMGGLFCAVKVYHMLLTCCNALCFV